MGQIPSLETARPTDHLTLYNGFWSQSGPRMSGFSDTPLKLSPDAETYHDIFESKYVTSYLETYADEHV